MPQTTYGSISQRTAAWAAANMLAHAEPVLILSKFGQIKSVPKNKAETVIFRRPIPFAPALTPLAEGVTPTPHRIQYEDVPVTMKQWGDLVEITDKVNDLSEDPVLADATKLAGEQAGATLEQVIWGVIKGGTSVFYANGATRNTVNTPISLNKQRAVTRYLARMKAKRITNILSGSVQIGTKPVEAAWIALCHTDLEADIRSMPGFLPVAAYGSRTVVSPYEIGSVENVRYVGSPDLAPFADAGGAAGTTMLSTSGTAADVYPVIYIGEEAYGLVPLKGSESVTPTVINPGDIDKSDPLGQRGYVGWKAWFNAVRLNETWMARLEVAVTKL